MRQLSSTLWVLIVLIGGAPWGLGHAAEPLPEPAIVTPAPPDNPTAPPSDAVILFDGKDMSAWTHTDGKPAGWTVADGVATAGKGDIISKHYFSDAQVHVEFKLPESGKGHGNSGLYFHNLYEVQIIDSHSANKFQPAQQCAGLYKKFPPRVNACKAPGEWQTYDIIFHSAKLDDAGKVVTPARFTVFHNGVLVQYNRPLWKGTGGGAKNKMISKGPLKIQDHGSPVQFRNIWLRPIPPVNEYTGPALSAADLKKQAERIEPRLPGLGPHPGHLPSDAVVLFDGKSLEGWSNDKWKLADGYMEVTRSGGNNTKAKFGDVQLHVEWATPSEVKGNSQGRGNSGVYLHGRYEVQVLDSFDNKTYPDGQAASIYKQYPPLVNASRGPGQWQTYDIVYRAAKYDAQGKLTDPGGFTVLHNGVLVQDHVINKRVGKTGPKDGKPITGHLHLQDHGNPVRYRNIWYRPLN